MAGPYSKGRQFSLNLTSKGLITGKSTFTQVSAEVKVLTWWEKQTRGAIPRGGRITGPQEMTDIQEEYCCFAPAYLCIGSEG